ncbi:hypothetical protein GGR54DRAFT_265572 [Hypoxylon sp. NC1633]|nr:hypothetical protein GGR54DRAFT_265572 [Hypoxylon sp. NC1633]
MTVTKEKPTQQSATQTATAQRYNGPARDGDWVNYQDTITSLYLDQNKSLKEVMRIMREEYYFFATEKMYKIRFNKWGLHKKLRAHQVAELLVQRGKRAAIGKTSVSFVHGRKVDADRLNTYLRRVSPARRKELEAILSGRSELSAAQRRSIEIICRTPSPEPEPEPVPRRLEAPDGLRLPEECVQIVYSYVSGAFDGALFRTTSNNELVFPVRGKTWLDPVSSARQLFVNGFTEQAFRMLKITFDDFKAVMTRQDPSLIVETCLALGALLYCGPGLAESLVNYGHNMSRIVFSPRHPLHLLFARLKGASRDDIARFASMIMQSYLQAVQRASRLKPTYLATLYRGMLNSNFIEAPEVEAHMQRLLEDLEAGTPNLDPGPNPSPTPSPDTYSSPKLAKDAQMLRYHVEWMRTLHGSPTEAAAAARSLKETRKVDPRLARFGCYNMLRTLPTSALGPAERVALLRASLDICEADFGRHDNATVTLLATLQGCLRRAGNVHEADAVRREFEIRWDEVWQGLEGEGGEGGEGEGEGDGEGDGEGGADR